MINDLNIICYQLGQDIFFTQAAGGNVSIKENSRMKIKASGKWLSDALKEDIFVEVEFDYNDGSVRNNDLPKIIQKSKTTIKPSIETIVHAIIPSKIVVHIHHVNSIVHLVHSECEKLIHEKLKNYKHPYQIIEYVKPGTPLALEIKKCLNSHPDTEVFLLKNHGVFFSANSIDQIINQVNSLHELFELKYNLGIKSKIGIELELSKMHNTGLKLLPSAIIQSLVHQEKSRRMIKDLWALYPDHLVFLGEKPNILDQVELEELGEDKPQDGIYFILNQGVFSKGPYTETQFQYLECFSHIIHRLIDRTKVCILNTTQILEITNWESEKYRINLSK